MFENIFLEYRVVGWRAIAIYSCKWNLCTNCFHLIWLRHCLHVVHILRGFGVLLFSWCYDDVLYSLSLLLIFTSVENGTVCFLPHLSILKFSEFLGCSAWSLYYILKIWKHHVLKCTCSALNIFKFWTIKITARVDKIVS